MTNTIIQETAQPIKTCFKCGQSMPLSEFYAHPQMSDGHLGKCKECTKKDVREHRASNNSVREYDRKRGKRPDRIAKNNKRNSKNKKLYPEKFRARYAVSNAIRDGRLERGVCEICGAAERVEAHHDDYSTPLDVRWLCSRHHSLVHNEKTRKLSRRPVTDT